MPRNRTTSRSSTSSRRTASRYRFRTAPPCGPSATRSGPPSSPRTATGFRSSGPWWMRSRTPRSQRALDRSLQQGWDRSDIVDLDDEDTAALAVVARWWAGSRPGVPPPAVLAAHLQRRMLFADARAMATDHFVGREDVLADLRARYLAPAGRAVSIWGLGGVGKSALACAVGHGRRRRPLAVRPWARRDARLRRPRREPGLSPRVRRGHRRTGPSPAGCGVLGARPTSGPGSPRSRSTAATAPPP